MSDDPDAIAKQRTVLALASSLLVGFSKLPLDLLKVVSVLVSHKAAFLILSMVALSSAVPMYSAAK